MDVLENVWTLVKVFNGLANGALLFVFALVALILIAAGVAHTRQRIRQARQAGDGRQTSPPTRLDQILHDELGREADRMADEYERRRDGAA